MADESAAEVAYRLKHEQRCRELAIELKAKLAPEGLSFCLVIATIDGTMEAADKRFSNVSYVSSCRREDAARLMTELVDRWWSDGISAEPTVQTCSAIREAVHKMGGIELGQVMTNARHRVREIIEAPGAEQRAQTALLLACEAMAIFDMEMRRALAQGGN